MCSLHYGMKGEQMRGRELLSRPQLCHQHSSFLGLAGHLQKGHVKPLSFGPLREEFKVSFLLPLSSFLVEVHLLAL